MPAGTARLGRGGHFGACPSEQLPRLACTPARTDTAGSYLGAFAPHFGQNLASADSDSPHLQVRVPSMALPHLLQKRPGRWARPPRVAVIRRQRHLHLDSVSRSVVPS